MRIAPFDLRTLTVGKAYSEEITLVIIPASSSLRNSSRTLFLSRNGTDLALQNIGFASLLIGNLTFLFTEDTNFGDK